MKAAEVVIQRRKTVIILWVIAFLLLTPIALGYGKFIGYSVTPGSLSNSESARAQRLLSPVAPSNSTLVVVYQPGRGESMSEIENRTISFQSALDSSGIPFYSGSSSVFSDYQEFLEKVLTKGVVAGMRDTYYNFTALAREVYAFPSSFLAEWSRYGYSHGSISAAAAAASYDGSGYESLFLSDLNQTFSTSPTSSPAERVQNATASAAFSHFFNLSPFLIFPVIDGTGYNVTDFQADALQPVSDYLTAASGQHISVQLLQSTLVAGDNASEYYFSRFGLLGVPSFISQEHVSPDNSTYLISVNFNVTEDYRGTNGFYPAQSATSAVRALSQEYLGTAQVTGQGAVAADTAQTSASAGYAFGLIFVLLCIAVGLLFASYVPAILVLIVVTLATILGYVAIYLTGLFLVRVDYVVTDVLAAVVLGVSTDYFVFILSRYREELREGRSSFDALSTATRRTGPAIAISGLTVAVGLGAISLVSGLESWGPVLSLTILLTVALETTLVPAMLSLIGPRVFTGRITLRRKGAPASSRGTRIKNPSESAFYKAARFSRRHKVIVAGVMLLLAAPSAYLWFNLPTTYNINEGLPQGTPSVRALRIVDQEFGSNLVYPTFVAVSFARNATSGSGGLTAAATSSLEGDAKILLDTQGVEHVMGPTINGTRIEPSSLDSQFVFNHGSNAYFVVMMRYDPYSESAISLVNHLRQNGQFLVGGLTSSIVDQQRYYEGAFAELELVIVLAIGAVLGFSFRSSKYPLIALTGVFVSVSWTTAILYLISKFVLGEALVFLIPIVLFVILMSLGNDFAVFILSRVREEQRAFGFEEGLARAMVGSGAVVTALGIILAASLGSLGLVAFGYLEQLGLAFVISLVLDTFVIRLFYFPSMLLLLRDRRRGA